MIKAKIHKDIEKRNITLDDFMAYNSLDYDYILIQDENCKNIYPSELLNNCKVLEYTYDVLLDLFIVKIKMGD